MQQLNEFRFKQLGQKGKQDQNFIRLQTQRKQIQLEMNNMFRQASSSRLSTFSRSTAGVKRKSKQNRRDMSYFDDVIRDIPKSS